jgi:hypothetical protein
MKTANQPARSANRPRRPRIVSLLAILSLTTLVTAPASPASQASVEVTIQCPLQAYLGKIDWRGEVQGSYYENGKKHDLTFKGGGPTDLHIQPYQVTRSGQTMNCSYRGPGVIANYRYTIHRDVISCVPLNSSMMKCNLKP